MFISAFPHYAYNISMKQAYVQYLYKKIIKNSQTKYIYATILNCDLDFLSMTSSFEERIKI